MDFPQSLIPVRQPGCLSSPPNVIISLSWREQDWVHLSVSPAQLISLTDLATGDSIHISSG